MKTKPCQWVKVTITHKPKTKSHLRECGAPTARFYTYPTLDGGQSRFYVCDQCNPDYLAEQAVNRAEAMGS